MTIIEEIGSAKKLHEEIWLAMFQVYEKYTCRIRIW